MRNSFDMRGARFSALTGMLPGAHGQLGCASLGVMVRQQFGLGSYGLGEALTQRLSGLLMEVLPGAMEQRLVGDLLDERMLEV